MPITFVLCIFLLVNLAFASENSDSSSHDETSATAQVNKGLDSYFPWIHPRSRLFPRPWSFIHLHPRPWSFVLPPMPMGVFHPKFLYPWAYRYSWPFMHQPAPSAPKGDNEGKK